MTPAIRSLKTQNIPFKVHQYHHDTNAKSYGGEAAEKLDINAAQVFKTLVVSCSDNENSLAVAIIPVSHQLNLKMLAKALKVKKVKMAEAKRVETTTGYVLGGVSPLGQKKSLTTIIDISADSFATIFVSGGKRGLEIELSASSLAKLTGAKQADIKT